MQVRLVRALGWLAIVHGLSHAVLPMRGSIAPAAVIGDWTPVVLYAIAMVGFVTAGLGLVGLRPLDRAISPLLVLSSGLSLVAIQRLGDRDLLGGSAFDVAFLILGLWRGYAGWPARGTQHGPVAHALGLCVGFAFLFYVALAAVIFPWHRTWGSTSDEITMALPGDDAARDPAFEIQHAVTINAPPDRVWPWLVQLGQDRAGFYSYAWLERAFGADVHNVFEIRPEWQRRDVGDRVRAAQRTYLAGLLGSDLGWTVKAVEENRSLVLDQWGAFVLLPTANGGTRFVIRTRTSARRIATWVAAADFLAFQLPHFIMERRMMLTIKTLAESPTPASLAATR